MSLAFFSSIYAAPLQRHEDPIRYSDEFSQKSTADTSAGFTYAAPSVVFSNEDAKTVGYFDDQGNVYDSNGTRLKVTYQATGAGFTNTPKTTMNWYGSATELTEGFASPLQGISDYDGLTAGSAPTTLAGAALYAAHYTPRTSDVTATLTLTTTGALVDSSGDVAGFAGIDGNVYNTNGTATGLTMQDLDEGLPDAYFDAATAYEGAALYAAHYTPRTPIVTATLTLTTNGALVDSAGDVAGFADALGNVYDTNGRATGLTMQDLADEAITVTEGADGMSRSTDSPSWNMLGD